MTNFDNEMAIERIQELYKDRGLSRSKAVIYKLAEMIKRKRQIPLIDALEEIEGTLLDDNPNPERWE